jgi:hypothetical protein
MKILYIDCRNSGISGDMFLAALLDLIPNHTEVIDMLTELKNYIHGVSTLKISLEKKKKNDIWVKQLQIQLKESKEHRSVKNLKEALNGFLEDYHYSATASAYAKNVFHSLIKAEAEVHETLENEIHLHELSSVDTLIDILGVTKGLEELGIFSEAYKVFCSELPVGGGTIIAAHGEIPIPAPATVKILERSTLIMKAGPVQDEISTPTGVALLANLNPINKNISFTLQKSAQSIGKKSFPNFLNMLRVFMGKGEKKFSNTLDHPLLKYREKISVIETNIDDVSGEIIGDFICLIEKENILDVQVQQCLTKKNRPSYIIKILTKPEYTFNIIEDLIENIGTLGVRYYTTNRICVERKIHSVDIEIDQKSYPVQYKYSYFVREGERIIVNIKPEYDDLKKIREITRYPIKRIQHIFFNTINFRKQKIDQNSY